ncbi:MAG: hypothetical protein K5890_10010 [Bacteroidales bacterium]|nr:hypothetical protein [Bacteroidales bacterium]
MKRKQYTQVENRAQKYYIFLKKKRGGRKKRWGLQIDGMTKNYSVQKKKKLYT